MAKSSSSTSITTEATSDNAGVDVLWAELDTYTEQIYKYAERRLFLAYFYLGDYQINKISDEVAVKYKSELKISPLICRAILSASEISGL